MAPALRSTALLAAALAATGCGSAPAASARVDAGGATAGADGGASVEPEAAAPSTGDAGDGGGAPGRFVTGVVRFSPAACTGFGQRSMPQIVEGPPVGGGTDHGSLDVVSLGSGGSIVVTFAPNAIVDGPGPDFIVFENPFWIGGDSNDVYAEPGEVSVSDDGVTWSTFPCTPTFENAPDGTGTAPPYGQCAGWKVVYSTPQDGISPFDPGKAGGNAYDLADLGVKHARYVRIVDRTEEACPEAGPRPDTNGFDLDAIAIVNAELP